jgi:hypothetical protein
MERITLHEYHDEILQLERTIGNRELFEGVQTIDSGQTLRPDGISSSDDFTSHIPENARIDHRTWIIQWKRKQKTHFGDSTSRGASGCWRRALASRREFDPGLSGDLTNPTP